MCSWRNVIQTYTRTMKLKLSCRQGSVIDGCYCADVKHLETPYPTFETFLIRNYFHVYGSAGLYVMEC